MGRFKETMLQPFPLPGKPSPLSLLAPEFSVSDPRALPWKNGILISLPEGKRVRRSFSPGRYTVFLACMAVWSRSAWSKNVSNRAWMIWLKGLPSHSTERKGRMSVVAFRSERSTG